jgi:hypothetical protein
VFSRHEGNGDSEPEQTQTDQSEHSGPASRASRLFDGLINLGGETVKVVGFFSAPGIVSSFDEPVHPFGMAVLNQGAPAPVTA